MQESVIDFPKAGLCPEIWEKVVDDTGLGDMWKLRQDVKDKLVAIIQMLQAAHLLTDNDLTVHVTGSITSNQYTENADIDLHFHSDCMQFNSNEEVDELNKTLRSTYKQEFIGKHPIEIYYQDSKFQDYMSVGCYDVINDIWEVGPELADSRFNPYAEYYDEAKKQSEAMASQIRNKILSIYETAIALKKNFGTEFGQNLRGVLLEQLASVQALYDSIRKTRKVYSSPTSKEEALQFRTSRKWHIADTAFKLFDKYGYLAILKQFIEDFKLMSETSSVDEEAANDIIATVKNYIGNADKLMDSEFYETEVTKSTKNISDTPQYDRVYNEINKLISQADDQKFGARDKLNRGNKCILLWHGDVKKDEYGFDDYSGCDRAWDPKKSWGLVEVQTFPNHEDLTEAQADEAIEKARSFISKHSSTQVDEASHDTVKIWVDDVRPTPHGYMTIQSVDEFIEWFDKNGSDKIEVLDLDHDAGKFHSKGGDYIRILDYLEFQGVENLKVRIHSDNPVGRQNMQRIIKKNGWKEVYDLMTDAEQVDEGAKDAISAGLLAALLAVPGILPAKTVQKSIDRNQKYEMIVKDLNQNVRMLGRYTELQAANIIARTLYAEARNDGEEGMEAVASVIYNRADGKAKDFVNVCKKNGYSQKAKKVVHQFSCWGKMTDADWSPSSFKVRLPKNVKTGTKEQVLWKKATEIAGNMLNGSFKPTTDATMYYNPQKCSPDWADQLTDIKIIGSHKFGKLKNHSPFK